MRPQILYSDILYFHFSLTYKVTSGFSLHKVSQVTAIPRCHGHFLYWGLPEFATNTVLMFC